MKVRVSRRLVGAGLVGIAAAVAHQYLEPGCPHASSGYSPTVRLHPAGDFGRPTVNTKQKEASMTTAIIFHDVQDGAVWARAWKKGPGSRHELFGNLGIKCRNFRDPENPNATGLIVEIPDMTSFRELLDSDEGQKAMREDGLKVETMRMLVEFTP